MAKSSGLGDNFYIAGYDLSTDVSALTTIGSPRGVLDVQSIGSLAAQRLYSLGDGLIEFNTWFDDAALLAHVALKGLPTADTQALYFRGTAKGNAAAGLVCKQVNYDWSRGQDMSLAGTVQCLGQGFRLEWGTQLTAGGQTDSSAAYSASIDDSASTSAGIRGYLQIIDINSGAPTIKIQHSANDSSWSDLVSFAAVSNGAEPSVERKTANGTVNRYVRVVSTGTFSNCKFVVMYSRGTAQDDEDLS